LSQITQIEAYQQEVFSSVMKNGKEASHDVYTL